MTTTTKRKDVLAEMFQENTGRHMLDSGGAYGRNWERNQGKDIASEPSATLEFTSYREGELNWDFTLNAYHFCNERLDYNAKWDAKFQRFAKKYEDEGWLAVIEAWFESLEGKYHVGGIYGEGQPVCENTYNSENNLSQTLQFYVARLTAHDHSEELNICILQVHGGCDVRGGYTAPRVFDCSSEPEMFYFANGNIGCDGSTYHGWYTDDAYHWYPHDDEVRVEEKGTLFGDTVKTFKVKQLEDYKMADFQPEKTGDYTYTAFCPVCLETEGVKNPLRGAV